MTFILFDNNLTERINPCIVQYIFYSWNLKMKNKIFSFCYWLKITLINLKNCNFFAYGISYFLYKFINKNKIKKLSKYHNIHSGQCVILGTGPSLTLDNLEKLIRANKYVFIGVNTLYKIYSELHWKADYYCVIDPNTYAYVGEDIKKYHRSDLFIASNRIKDTDKNVNKFCLNCSSLYKLSKQEYFSEIGFSSDITKDVFDGCSVVYASLQIAVYMGFKEIYLLGVDCNYESKIENHSEILSYGENYKYAWSKLTGKRMIQGLSIAKKFAENHNIKIYNLSQKGNLDLFEKVDINEVIGQ